MYGALIGDYVGSIYEWNSIKTKEFPFFQDRCELTDDSFMTIAVASACMKWREHHDLKVFQADVKREMQRIGRAYPDRGYGGRFYAWLFCENPQPYGSYGNGSAMRVSPCGFVAESLEEAEALAEASAMPSHNHPEGIKGAQAIAAAVYLAFHGRSKDEIRGYIQEQYYPLEKALDEIRPDYDFDVTCQGSVPQSIQAFLESTSFEDAIRNAVSLGGDSDTMAAIAGGIAEAYYGVPEWMRAYMDHVVDASCERTEKDIVKDFRQGIENLRKLKL